MEKQSSLKEHICKLEQHLLEPKIRTDPAELDQLLADVFWIRKFGKCLV